MLSCCQPCLWQQLSIALAQSGLTPQQLPNTCDMWAVDYLPVQVAATDFVQFRYEPSYLLPYGDVSAVHF